MGKRKTSRDAQAVGELALPIGLLEEAASNQASTAEATPSCASTGTRSPEETRPKEWYTLRDKTCKHFVVLTRCRSEAEAALGLIALVMQTLKLPLSPTKTRLVRIDDRSDFPGLRHLRSRPGQLHRVPRNKPRKACAENALHGPIPRPQGHSRLRSRTR